MRRNLSGLINSLSPWGRGQGEGKLKCGLMSLLILLLGTVSHAASKGDHPTIVETSIGRQLVLPSDLKAFLEKEYPKARLLSDTDFDKPMLKFYFSNLIGIHPAIAWGDFNNDKQRDYILLLNTGQTQWGLVVQLVILNGSKGKEKFEVFSMGEVLDYKESYVSFRDAKLIKGTFQKGGWYLNWDDKEKNYVLVKS